MAKTIMGALYDALDDALSDSSDEEVTGSSDNTFATLSGSLVGSLLGDISSTSVAIQSTSSNPALDRYRERTVNTPLNLDVLEKVIPGAGSEMKHAARENAIEEKVCRLGVHPLDILFTGATGVGKSSTLNALFSKDISKVGDTPDPETMDTKSFFLGNAQNVRIWDSPGLGDTPEQDKKHMKKIRELLLRRYTTENSRDNNEYGTIDLAVVILDGSSRDLGTAGALIRDIILPLMGKGRIIFALNKCDMIMGGRHWDSTANSPDPVLLAEMNERSRTIAARLSEDCGLGRIKPPVCYSAVKGYNIESLFHDIINSIPNTKRKAPGE